MLSYNPTNNINGANSTLNYTNGNATTLMTIPEWRTFECSVSPQRNGGGYQPSASSTSMEDDDEERAMQPVQRVRARGGSTDTSDDATINWTRKKQRCPSFFLASSSTLAENANYNFARRQQQQQSLLSQPPQFSLNDEDGDGSSSALGMMVGVFTCIFILTLLFFAASYPIYGNASPLASSSRYFYMPQMLMLAQNALPVMVHAPH